MIRTRIHDLHSVFVLLIAGCLTLAGAETAHAQSGARSVGALSTGGGASAVSAPTTALYTNPANMTVGPRELTVELRFLDIRSYAGGDLFQFQPYNDLFDASQTVTGTEIEETLNSWFGGDLKRAAVYTDVVPFSLTYQAPDRRWAAGLGLRLRTATSTSVNGGLVNLLLQGTGVRDEDETSTTVPVNARYRLMSTVDVTGAFSYVLEELPLPGGPLSVGIAPKLVFGTGYADAQLDSEVTVGEEVITHSFDYTAKATGLLSTEVYDEVGDTEGNGTGSPLAGTGFGVDLGATYEVQSGLYVSASVTDLGRIQWSDQPQVVTPADNEFRFDGIELDLQTLEEEYDNDFGTYVEEQITDSLSNTYEEVNRDRSSFATGLPATLQVNGTWDREWYTLNGGATVGLNDEAAAVSTTPVLHAGGEVELGPVPLRAGLRFGGFQAMALSFGIGLDVGFYQFDLGVSATPSTSLLGSGGRYAVGLSLATIRF